MIPSAAVGYFAHFIRPTTQIYASAVQIDGGMMQSPTAVTQILNLQVNLKLLRFEFF